MKTWAVASILFAVMLAGCAVPDEATQEAEDDQAPLPDVETERTLSITLDPAYPKAGQLVMLSADLQDADGTETYEWRVAGQAKQGRETTAVFKEAGDHTVQVVAYVADAPVASATESVFVLNRPKENATGDPDVDPDAGTGPVNNTVSGNETEQALSSAVRSVRDKLLAGQTVTLEGRRVAFLGLGSASSGQFELDLERSDLLTPDWFEIDGQEVYPSFVEVYEGGVVGDSQSVARLTLAPDWIHGIVRVGDVHYTIRIGMEGNFPKGLEIPYLAQRIEEPQNHDLDGMEPPDCLAAAPDAFTPVSPVGRSTLDPIEVGIILDADAEFLRIFKQHSFPLMVAYLAEVDAIYDHEMSIRYDLVGLHLTTDPDFYPAPEDAAPLSKMVEYWSHYHRDERETVHLYTGHPSSYAQANCIGGAGFPDYGYTFTTTQWAAYSGASSLRHTQTYAHELGHILQAHHHYHSVEGELQTIMAQGGNKYAPVFSSVTKGIIRGYAETWLDD